MNKTTGASAYARVSIESAVLGASQAQLTTLLFDGAMGALVRARLCFQNGDIAGKGHNLSKAMDIIENGLKGPLMEWQDDPLAQQLIALYDYMTRQLLRANLKNDMTAVSETEQLLGNITSGWKESQQAMPSQGDKS